MALAEYSEKLPHGVEETERDVTPSPPTQRPRRFWEKLGYYNIAVLVIGTAAIALALAFLLFIWGASTHARISGVFPQLWFLIVDNDWASRVITLSSVLIRVATAAQLGVFAAILAALILERVGVSTEDLPLVSMIRCLNSGPHSLALSVSKSIFTKALMPYSILVVLAILNAFALQFTSTILLNDFDTSSIVTSSLMGNITIGLSQREVTGYDDKNGHQNPYGGVDYWKTGPTTYNRFAEYKEAGSERLEYVDTGRTYRGFLPFRNPFERQTLRNYTGPMTVVDSRVICVKPVLSNVSIYGGDDQTEPSIRAAFTFSDTHPDLIANEALDGKGHTMNCTIPTSDWFMAKAHYANISLCAIGSNQARLINGIKPDPAVNVSIGGMGQTSMHLLFQTTGNGTEWAESNDTLEEIQSSKATWTSFRLGNLNLNLTACFINPLPAEYEVQALSTQDVFDVELDWNSTAAAYNSTKIRQMLGATINPATVEERGLLRLLPIANWTAADMEVKHNISTNHFIWDTLFRYFAIDQEENSEIVAEATQTTIFSEDAHPERSVHRSHVEIFQKIFRETGNTALALQALWTVLLQMAYYDFFSQYDVNAPAQFTNSAPLYAPIRWKALGAVLGLLALHTSLIVTALVLFFKRTEMSLLGNAWQAVSQVMTTDTADAVHQGATTTDKEVRGIIRHGGAADGRIRISRNVYSGQTEATAVRQRHGATYSAPVGHV